MNTVPVKLSILCLLMVLMVLPVFGQNDPAVEDRVKKLEDENQQLREMVEKLQQRLDRIEGTPAAEPPKEESTGKAPEEKKKKKKSKSEPNPMLIEPQPFSADLMNATGEEIGTEEKEKGKGKEWLPSLSGENFRLGGRLQFEFYDSERESRLSSAVTDNPDGTFQFDEVRLYLDADFKNNIRFYSAMDIEGEDNGVVEAFVDFDELPFNSQLRLGLQPSFYRPGRYTETYPLAGIAFWRSRDLGVTWTGTYDPFYLHLAVMNGTELDDRYLVEDHSGPMLSDDNSRVDLNGDKEVSAGLGFRWDFDAYGKLDILGFGQSGQLSQHDVEYLQDNVPGYGFSFNKDKELAGVNFEYDIEKWDFFAQAITGRHGDLERTAWYAEISRNFDIKGLKYLNAVRPLIRYGEMDNNMAPLPYSRNGSLTWDRQQWLFAVIAEMVRNVNFRFEYALNEENTGGPDAQNNEMLFQVEIQF